MVASAGLVLVSVKNTGCSAESRRWWWLLPRLFWASLFLIHLAPFAALTSQLFLQPSTKILFSLAGVLGVSALALLKALDVSWLRIHLTSRGWGALILIGLLFHGETVANRLPESILVETSVVVVVSLVCCDRRTLQKFQQFINQVLWKRFCSQYSWIEEVTLAALSTHPLVIISPRGPPVR